MLLASLSHVFTVGSNAGQTVFQRTVQGCWLPTPFTSLPFTSPTVRHRVPSGSERAIPRDSMIYKECILAGIHNLAVLSAQTNYHLHNTHSDLQVFYRSMYEALTSSSALHFSFVLPLLPHLASFNKWQLDVTHHGRTPARQGPVYSHLCVISEPLPLATGQ